MIQKGEGCHQWLIFVTFMIQYYTRVRRAAALLDSSSPFSPCYAVNSLAYDVNIRTASTSKLTRGTCTKPLTTGTLHARGMHHASAC